MRVFNRTVLTISAVCIAAFHTGPLSAQTTTTMTISPSKAAADFQAVTSKLDSDGTDFHFTNYRGSVDNFFSIFEPMLKVNSQIYGFGIMIKSSLTSLGFNDLSVGSSKLPLENGLEIRKTYIRSVGRHGMFSLYGQVDQPLKSLSFIPSNANACWCGHIEFAGALPMLNDAAKAAIGPGGPSMIAKLMDSGEKRLSVDIRKVLSSLGNEYELHFTDKKTTGGKLIPVVTGRLAVKDSTLFETVKKLVGSVAEIKSMPDDEGNQLIRLKFNSGDDAKVVFVENENDWLAISTDPTELARTRNLSQNKTLMESAAFKQSAYKMPAHFDSLTYISQAYSKESLSNLHKGMEAMNESIPSDSQIGAGEAMVRAAMGKFPEVIDQTGIMTPYTGWRINDADGVLMTEVGKPRHLASTEFMFFGGIGVAIAVPAFLRARDNARARACQENLSVLKGSKEQYALENHKKAGSSVTMHDIQPYLHGDPTCPADGEYTLNPIGTDPTCSVGDDTPKGMLPHKLED